MSELLASVQSKLDDPSIPYQKVVLSVLLAVSFFESFISSRQRPYLDSHKYPNLPASLRPFLSPSQHASSQETYLKSQRYARDKLRFSSITGMIALLQSFTLLTDIAVPLFHRFGFTNVPYKGQQWTLLKGFWDYAGYLTERIGAKGGVIGGVGELKQTAMFIVLMNLVSTTLSIPEGLWKNFRLEEKHGFNKMTYGTFVKDQFKGLFLTFILEVPLTVGLVSLINWVGPNALVRLVTYVLLFSTILVLIMVPLGPYVIMPLFNKFTPLSKESPVYEKVKNLAVKVGFPTDRIYVVDGSTRSSHSNAFVTGLPGLPKQIVIYDTLLEKATPEEVEAIVCHELGHYRHHHIVYLVLTALIQIAFSISIFTLFLSNQSLLNSFGFNTIPLNKSKVAREVVSKTSGGGGPTIISLFLASTLFTPLSAFLSFLTNTITRSLEYDADGFAVGFGKELTKNLKKALIGIHEKNLAVYEIDPVYSAYNHNHPTLVERLEALDKKLEEKEGKEK